jgi:outer membrane protein assembly factor BamB
MVRLASLLLILGLVSFPASAQEPAPWATYRGNGQRTGHTDGVPGPASPKVLWVLKSKDHYIASPLPAGNRLVVSGLGAFNVPIFSCLNADPKLAARNLWTKTTPYLRQATVSSPSLVGGKLIFGDGMHQTDGAILHCLELETGLPIWQLPVPGKLVHLEGSPTVADGKLFIGGGAAGVLCVDVDKVTLQGKEMDIPAVQKVIALKWKELQDLYELEKKKKNEFAMPPNEDQLPRAEPKVVWQQGKDKWHVDAPVTLVGNKVLVSSAFLDKEQEGDRALFCLDAKTGAVQWKTPLRLNPWGGPSVLGDTVILPGSSISYDTQAISKKTKGLIAAFNLADGKEKWSKDITGGVVGCAALADGAAVMTATDGKVRAFEIGTGERRWIYETKMPCFAPPAIAGNTVYAGDLKGVMHAIDLKTGTGQWTLDLGSHKEIASPGMFYAGPVVQAGRLYAVTCNLEGPNARQPTVVICIGEK